MASCRCARARGSSRDARLLLAARASAWHARPVRERLPPGYPRVVRSPAAPCHGAQQRRPSPLLPPDEAIGAVSRSAFLHRSLLPSLTSPSRTLSRRGPSWRRGWCSACTPCLRTRLQPSPTLGRAQDGGSLASRCSSAPAAVGIGPARLGFLGPWFRGRVRIRRPINGHRSSSTSRNALSASESLHTSRKTGPWQGIRTLVRQIALGSHPLAPRLAFLTPVTRQASANSNASRGWIDPAPGTVAAPLSTMNR